MENWTTNSLCGASATRSQLVLRERAVAPLSAAQGTGLPAAGSRYGGAAFGFGFQPAAGPQHATTGTPVMTVDIPLSARISDTDVDVRVPPRGRPL